MIDHATRYAALIAERTATSQRALLDTHPCNLLCGDGVHVDLVWMTPDPQRPDWQPHRLRQRWEWLYEVEVLDVWPVEAPPPGPHTRQIPLVGSGCGPDAETWGIRWRVPA